MMIAINITCIIQTLRQFPTDIQSTLTTEFRMRKMRMVIMMMRTINIDTVDDYGTVTNLIKTNLIFIILLMMLIIITMHKKPVSETWAICIKKIYM